MQYSTLNGQRVSPFPKGRGKCDICGSDTTAKCGEKIMWHWAHNSKRDCDPWWENETEWHRQWKEHFPESFREVVHHDPVLGEKHRADIKSDKGIILEIQNSPISLEELRSREAFYRNLVWIVNGKKFRDRFNIWNAPLPDPSAAGFEDIVFLSSQHKPSCSMFMRRTGKWPMSQIFSTREIDKEISEAYVGHHSFHWVRPHIAWLEATCPVLIDFGGDLLWRFESYKGEFSCVRAISKHKVVLDIKNEQNASEIATRFHPATGLPKEEALA